MPFVDDETDKAASIPILNVTLILCIAFSATRMLGVYLCPVAYSMTGDLFLFLISSLFLLFGIFYLYLKYDRYLSKICIVMGLTLICQVCAREFCNIPFYFGSSYSLQDESLAHIDQFLGFCWPCILGWFNEHSTLNSICTQFYHSIFFQPILITGILIVKKDLQRISIYMIAYNVSYFMMNVVAFRFPALGVYEFFHLSQASHPNISVSFANQMTAPINAIRDGALPPIYTEQQVLISFPSFHAVLAVLFSWSAWRSALRWPIAACNVVMLISTPVVGGHYLTDILAGLLVGVASIVISKRLLTVLLSSRAVDPAEFVRKQDTLEIEAG